jgi:transcriptional regulator with XRE-family HTH domain
MNIFSRNLKILRNNLGLTQEQLAKALNLEHRTVVGYETGTRIPLANTLINISGYFGISFDFLILNEECSYPKSVKLLKLAKTLDNKAYLEARSSIEAMINTFWSKKLNSEAPSRFDDLTIELTDSFNKNLKEIRNHSNTTQLQLAQTIGVSRTLVNHYETKIFPPIEKLIELSNFFNLSMHAMVTGERLFFDFDDRLFGKTILSADQQLTIEEKKTLINLLEAAIENKK